MPGTGWASTSYAKITPKPCTRKILVAIKETPMKVGPTLPWLFIISNSRGPGSFKVVDSTTPPLLQGLSLIFLALHCDLKIGVDSQVFVFSRKWGWTRTETVWSPLCVCKPPLEPSSPLTLCLWWRQGPAQPWRFQSAWKDLGDGPVESSHGPTAPRLAPMVSSLSHFLS